MNMDPFKQELKDDRRTVSLYRSILRSAKQNLDTREVRLLRRALNMALDACSRGSLKLGELSIYHALGVALIVTREIGLGLNSIIGSLLFDFVEDRKIDPADIREIFGEKVERLVNGLTKISGIDTNKSVRHAEELRNLLLTISSDIRVILVKLADRLYILRNLPGAEPDERIRITSETSFLYAPLAHRLGLYAMKSEMEDLVMKYNRPDNYRYVVKRLRETKASRDRFSRDFIRPVREKLEGAKLRFDIKSRTKSVYSIWSKMESQQIGFDEVYDLFAIRIILHCPPEKEKEVCWRAYSLVTDIYQPNPNRLRDWISVPKSNGYESLHTTVVVPGGKWVEIQIRTDRMNEIAEKGLAAHWKYKEGKPSGDLDIWIRKVRDILQQPESNAVDFIDNFKLSLYNKEIFVFTPKGDLKKLPNGATVLDFAFDIHTGIGAKCTGARVNGKNVPIRHRLQNGDRVEVITAKNQKPRRDWLNFVVTSRGKSKIRQALREFRLIEAGRGKEILKRRFKNWKIGFNEHDMNEIAEHFNLKMATDLYYHVATEKIDVLQIKEFIAGKEKQTREQKPAGIEEDNINRILSAKTGKAGDILVIDNKLLNVDYKMARCCNPIYGDDIFGFVTVGSGITIHRVSCPNASQLISKYGYRVVRAKWSDSGADIYFPATLHITGVDEMSIVSEISDVVSRDMNSNLRSIDIDSQDGMFEGNFTLFVRDTKHLKSLIQRISRIKGISDVKRLDSSRKM